MLVVHVRYFDKSLDLADLAAAGDADIDKAHGASALQAFLALTARDRLNDTRHVYAFYRDVRQAAGDHGEELEIDAPETPEAIWSHVAPTGIHLEAGRDDDRHVYVVAECECDWELEHGLMMVWRDGETLCKVGGYDGHVTNADAYDDDHLNEVVYVGIDPAFRTLLAG